MGRWLTCPYALVALATIAFAAEDLPKHDSDESFEIEPPILIPNLERDSVQPGNASAPESAGSDIHIEKLEIKLKLAEKRAAVAESQYKRGIIDKMEAENRPVRVLRLQSDLANARVVRAQENVDVARGQLADGEKSSADLDRAEAALAEAAEAARTATLDREYAELEAAKRDLERQKKLVALGSGRKSEVKRAEQKLAELQGAKD
jgi:hypothetical protein